MSTVLAMKVALLSGVSAIWEYCGLENEILIDHVLTTDLF